MRKVLAVLFLVTPLLSNAQEVPSLSTGYYIVVAAYRPTQEPYASRYQEQVNQSGHHAQYGLDPGRRFIYVYLDFFEDFDEAVGEMRSVRQLPGFAEAWVRVIVAGDVPAKAPVVNQNSTPQPTAPSAPAAQPQVSEPIASTPVTLPQKDTIETTDAVISSGIVEVPEPADLPTPAREDMPMTLANTKVFLSLINANNNRFVDDSEVEIIDADRGRLISAVSGNSSIILPDPKSNSGKLTLISKAFGYRDLQHELHYNPPLDTTGGLKIFTDSLMVEFDLVRYHKGDIEALYNVFFFNDAAIMQPESRYQLNSLLSMMRENPNYIIRLHGHTNGNASGRLLTMGPSRSFFSLADDTKEGSGSAKKLSEERANAIKEWLISNDVTPERVEIKAWGGKRMLHERNSSNAQRNVRVEVEVLAE